MNLKLAGDGQVKGLIEREVNNFDEAMLLLDFGEENRSYRETKVHEHSSRSHTIFRIQVKAQDHD